MHAETALCHALFEPIQKRHALILVIDVNRHALRGDFGVRRELGRQAVVVRGEEAEAADVRRDVVQDRLRDRYAVVTRSAAAQLVEDDEAARRGFGQDLLRLRQLDHERRLAGEDVVLGAEARHDAVDGREAGAGAGHVAADLREDDGDAGHAKDGAFAGCVGAGEEVDVG